MPALPHSMPPKPPPWESYLQYNDERLLVDHYEAMKSYIRYLTEYIDPETGILTEGNLGDWLGPEQEKNDNSLLWEAYFIYDLELMYRIAILLKRKEDAVWFNQLCRERKASFGRIRVNLYSDNGTDTVTLHLGEAVKEGTINRSPGGTIRYSQPLSSAILYWE